MPIQKLPRRVPIARKDKFKQEFDSMEAQGIISKYDGRDISPEWLNSFVIVKKPNGSKKLLDLSAMPKQWMMWYTNLKVPTTLLYSIQARDFSMFL